MFSLCSIVWLACAVWVLLGAVFVRFPNYIPTFILDSYAYGKAVKGKNKCMMVPKRTFSHFYLSGCVCITALFLTSLYVACGAGEWPYLIQMLMDTLRFPAKESNSDMFSTLIVLCCSNIQVIRRFLECKTVSIYSDGTISILVYLVGVVFYAALPVTSLAGTDLTQKLNCSELVGRVNIYHILGVALFLWASWQQNRIAVQFAKLRKDKSGKVENTGHHIPHGGLFEYVSCPHYFVEILIYFSLNVITAFLNTKLICLFLFVLANQLITGHYTHVWYKTNFKSYPKQRKAVFPYIF